MFQVKLNTDTIMTWSTEYLCTAFLSFVLRDFFSNTFYISPALHVLNHQTGDTRIAGIAYYSSAADFTLFLISRIWCSSIFFFLFIVSWILSLFIFDGYYFFLKYKYLLHFKDDRVLCQSE